MRIAAFGFRSLPPRAGCAGADKFAEELLPRLAERGCQVTAYNRIYKGDEQPVRRYEGVNIVSFRTTDKKGFDTLLHSLKCTYHIIRFNTADIVHIQNGGNSVWAPILRLFGKRVFISQDGVDWKRAKWPWYGKLYLYLSSFITAFAPNKVIFDNVFAKELFERKFGRQFAFIPFGSEVNLNADDTAVLDRLGLAPRKYFLFVGRFIPDKGLHYLVPAFEQTETNKKLVLVGGSPNPSDYEREIRSTHDERIVFPGFVYGDAVNVLMKHAYAYIQPSDVEGLSPVILQNMGLGTPIICSDIKENLFAVDDAAITFKRSDVDDLTRVLRFALDHPEILKENAQRARLRAEERFSWDAVVEQHLQLFQA
jgi:glycosyltransferase involved in cell wall biosynthesis